MNTFQVIVEKLIYYSRKGTKCYLSQLLRVVGLFLDTKITADGTFIYDLGSNIYLMELIFQVIDKIIKCNA